MDAIRKTLSEFGLSDNEITVYLEAIKHTEISPFQLARLTKIPRTTVYDIMMSLALKGLITVKTSQGLEKQQSWIVAKNPSVLRETICKRREDLIRLEVDVVDVLSTLKSSSPGNKQGDNLRYLPGKKGIEEAYSFISEVPPDVQIYFFDHLMPMDALGKDYVNKEVSQLLVRRVAKKQAKTLLSLNDWTRHVISYQYGRDKSYIDFHEYRFIDNPLFDLQNDTYIFLDKVVTICAKDEEIWASILTSDLVAHSFRSIFLTLWQTATPLTPSLIKSWGENAFLKMEKKRFTKLFSTYNEKLRNTR